MTTSSADPDKLHDFVRQTRPAREATETVQRGVSSISDGVFERSPDFNTSVPALATLATRLVSMGANETFVETIRTELLAADRHAAGVVTIPDATIETALAAAGVSTPPDPIEVEPSTMYGIPPTSGFVDDPICAANGNMVHHDIDLAFPGRASTLDLGRTYNSLLTERVGAFGPGWTSVLDVRLDAAEHRIEVHLPDGATAAFVRLDGDWVSSGRRLHRFERHDSGAWTVWTNPFAALEFDTDGQLTGWQAGTSRVDVTRESGQIVEATELGSGRAWQVTWDGDLVAGITDAGERSVTYTRDGDHLVRVSTPSGALHYVWTDGFLTSVADADGVRPFRNEYDADGRVTRQTSPFGRVTDYRYQTDGLTVITDQDGVRQAMVHDIRGNLTAVIDTDGSAMRLTYDHLDRVTRVVSRTGAVWQYRFDDRLDQLVERIDPDGRSVAWTWDSLGRPTSHTDRTGGWTTFEYHDLLQSPVRITAPDGGVTDAVVDDALDLPRSITDPDGVTTRFEYDDDGQVVAVIDALGGRTTFEHDRAGRVERARDTVGTLTQLRYDPAGRIVARSCGPEHATYTRTPAGRISGGSEPGNQEWSAEFGDHGAPVALTDATGATIRFAHDTQGNVTDVVAADGAVYRHEYDEVGQLVAMIDPVGHVSRQRYDGEGNVVELIDAEGRSARREIDHMGRTTRSIGPDGFATDYSHHPNGQIASVTIADGRTWSTEVDRCGRLVAMIDPTGARSELTYSLAGRLVERRSPAGRTETYEYDTAGRLSAMTDPSGVRHLAERDGRGRLATFGRDDAPASVTVDRDELGRVVDLETVRGRIAFEYDAAGLPAARTDGSGARSEYSWDSRGLLATATDAAGNRTTYAYDARGRRVAQTTDGRTSTWSYDATGWLAGTTDPAGVTAQITRDATGQVTGLRRGDDGWTRRLDPAGRELDRSTIDGDVFRRFEYDTSGRMAQASTPSGWASTFMWDDVDRLSAVTDAVGTSTIERDADGRAIAVTRADGSRTLIERDPIGRITRVHDDHGGDADLTAPAVEFDPAGRLLLGPDGTVHRYDDAGRLVESAPSDGAPTHFEYGDDGLLSVERSTSGTRRFGYDAAGRVASISVDRVGTTTFDYDLAGRRIAEHRPDGSSFDYRWNGLDQLVEIVRSSPVGEQVTIAIDVDALGRPSRVTGHDGSLDIGYDPVFGTPSQIGDVRIVEVAGHGWRSDDQIWATTPAGTADGLRLGSLTFLRARVLDGATHQFLTPDPLHTVPGTNGGASAYTYAWNDPINHVDPSGLSAITREEWDAIRSREESGRAEQFIDAMTENPWETVVAGLVVAAGIGLCFTPLAPIGVGVLVGAGMSAGLGFATGTADPLQIALGGVLGGVGGIGSVGTATMSVGRTLALGGATGAAGEAGSQLINGEPLDVGAIGVNGLLGVATAGVGRATTNYTNTYVRSAAVGATTDGGASVVRQALTGDHTIELGETFFDTAGGGVGGVTSHYFELQQQNGPTEVSTVEVDLSSDTELVTVYRGTASATEIDVHSQTGLMMSDAAQGSYLDGGDIDVAQAYSATQHDHAVSEWWGSETDYAQAHGAFGAEISEVSGDRTMVSVTTDPDVAGRYAGKDGTVFRAEVPLDSLLPQTLSSSTDSEMFAPHSIEMEPVGSSTGDD